jgi:RNA polymerase sigma-70 factor (ECF subfamily)
MSDLNRLKSEFEAQALPHLPKLYRLAYVRLGSKEDAEDIVQETYLKAFRAYARKHEGNLLAWLTSILINTIRDAKRKSTTTPTSQLDENDSADHLMALADSRLNPAEQMEANEIDNTLKNALKTTPEWLLTPFLLRELQQMTYKEIAQSLAIPIGTVMSRLSRARQHLCTKLGGGVDGRDDSQKPPQATKRIKEEEQL